MNVGTQYEQALAASDPGTRKANGVYYTPPALVEHVITRTLGRFLEHATPAQVEEVAIVDPACGCGAFLIAAYRCLLAWHSARRGLTCALRQRILRQNIFGADIDPRAVALANRSLIALAQGQLEALAPRGKVSDPKFNPPRGAYAPRWPNLRTGDALLKVNWDRQFTIVVGNPPWGQKEIAKNDQWRDSLVRQYPSATGIFDLFRPFVELGVRLTADSGHFGMVLPDIVLLKNYAPTRRLLLDTLTLERIDWWGQAFPGAQIDTATIIGRKQTADSTHAVLATIHDRPQVQAHAIPQALFASHPRAVFNLHLTPARQRLLDRIAHFPRLGEFFEVHEGVHSGNLRAELFVAAALDDSCRPLLFGRDEIAPYELRWQGRYIRLSAVPARRSPSRYANVGQQAWHQRAKLLLRRTGDRVLAAVDRAGRYASNNFFLLFPRQPHALDLDGLAALLNSGFMTWYFRAIEPRKGRAFAELKIKHLTTFPLPTTGAERLNTLGKQRGPAAAVDACVLDLFGIRPGELE